MTAEFTIQIGSIFSGTLTINLPAGAITDQFGNANAAFTGNYEYVGTAPKGCGLLVGSGMTLGLAPGTAGTRVWLPTLFNTRLLSASPLRTTSRYSRRTIRGALPLLRMPSLLTGILILSLRQQIWRRSTSAIIASLFCNWDDTTIPEFITPYTAAIPGLEAYAAAGGVVWVQGGYSGLRGKLPMPFGGQGNER